MRNYDVRTWNPYENNIQINLRGKESIGLRAEEPVYKLSKIFFCLYKNPNKRTPVPRSEIGKPIC